MLQLVQFSILNMNLPYEIAYEQVIGVNLEISYGFGLLFFRFLHRNFVMLRRSTPVWFRCES